MPIEFVTYVSALIYLSASVTCTSIAKVFQNVSHDRLTRFLQKDWQEQILLELLFKAMFSFSNGYLVLDDTVIRKSSDKRMENVSWIYSSSEKKAVLGYSVVLLLWTDGFTSIPVAFKIWKQGGLSKFDLALELLSYARNRLKIKPLYVIFDSWYPSKAILKRIRDYGWYFVCRLKRNRKFNDIALRHYKCQPYWSEVGILSGGLKVCIVRYGKKYFATNRLTLTSKEVRDVYRYRHTIEETFKFLKGQLHLERCQAWSVKAQRHHITMCCVAYCVLEREKLNTGNTLYRVKRTATLHNQMLPIQALEQLKRVA